MGMGRPSMAASSPSCSPTASCAPAAVPRATRYSCLPSDSRSSVAGSRPSRPLAASFLASAAVGWPLASRPTFTGISFSA
ncbi:Uncharacterised protein [Bordetella pertussis]|nr:Uncharacterised protein [Bordetella pertussis]